MSQILLTVIATAVGGAIASCTAFWLDRRREKARLDQLKAVIVAGIKDDLTHSLSMYDRLQDEWDKSKTVWFSTIQEFKESRQTYENHRDWVLLIDNAELRRKLFRYYLKTNELLNLARFYQERIYDITRRHGEIVRDIQFRQPDMSHETAVGAANTIMKEEVAEYNRLYNLDLPALVAKIATYKGEAQEGINDVANINVIG